MYRPRNTPSTVAGANSPGSLYVSELDWSVTEAMLFEIFNMVGPVASIRVCRDAVTHRSLGYAYVNYVNESDCERALDQLNYSIIKNRPCRIVRSQRDHALRKTEQGSIYIKSLEGGIDNMALHDVFKAFGNIFSCKVITDENGNSRGYGIVHYETAESAEAAIKAANGILLNDKQITVERYIPRKERHPTIDEPKVQFTNIYVRNIDWNVTSTEFRELFEPFGTVNSATLQTDLQGKSRGFGYVNFENHGDAERAVNELNGKEIRGRLLHVARAMTRAERAKDPQFSQAQAKQERQHPGDDVYKENPDSATNDQPTAKSETLYNVISSNSNNQNPPPDIVCPRDPKYYFADGSAVFQVAGVLFKLRGSLLAADGTKVTFKQSASSTLMLFDANDQPSQRPGLSDADAIQIPGVGLVEFRLLLLVLISNPGDPEFLNLITAAGSTHMHTTLTVMRYLRLGSLAYRFGLINLARWAWSQLHAVVKRSADSLANEKWDTTTLLGMLDHHDAMRNSKPEQSNELIAFFRLILSRAADNVSGTQADSLQQRTIASCVTLYKQSAALSSTARNIVLGSTFVTLLSLGPNSTAWKDMLARDERLTFYAAHADLQVSLKDHSVTVSGWLDWIRNPEPIVIKPASLCSACLTSFRSSWRTGFGTGSILKGAMESNDNRTRNQASLASRSNGSLGFSTMLNQEFRGVQASLALIGPQTIAWDIRLLALLPQCRQVLASNIRAERQCEKRCNDRALHKIDEHLNKLFTEQLVAAHNEFAK
ncbi:RNA recognition motif protein [Ceratobasidium sp. AG-Ba]|nr:RNA recognition motif protein [Ceratobasidium sp. AG-Ba]